MRFGVGGVRIEVFRAGQLRRVLEIEQASFPSDPYPAEVLRDLQGRCGELFLVARLGRRIAGYMVTWAGRGEAEIVSIAVDPALRRQGIGSRLLEESLERVRRAGVRRVHLMVREGSEGAIAFYERHGFRRAGRARGYYADGADAIRMSRPL